MLKIKSLDSGSFFANLSNGYMGIQKRGTLVKEFDSLRKKVRKDTWAYKKGKQRGAKLEKKGGTLVKENKDKRIVTKEPRNRDLKIET